MQRRFIGYVILPGYCLLYIRKKIFILKNCPKKLLCTNLGWFKLFFFYFIEIQMFVKNVLCIKRIPMLCATKSKNDFLLLLFTIVIVMDKSREIKTKQSVHLRFSIVCDFYCIFLSKSDVMADAIRF